MGTLPVDVQGSTRPTAATAQAFVLNATVVPDPILGFLALWGERAGARSVDPERQRRRHHVEHGYRAGRERFD
jgi:hypothetical protein